MYQQQDSTHTAHQAAASLPQGEQLQGFRVDSQHVQAPAKPLTPYQVLRQLPADATPAQQDSAIQAVFHRENTHLSTRPDTLHLPGHDVGKDPREVNLPQYYRETFFSNDTLLHPEISGGRYGVAGDPVPYTIRGDNTITTLLLLCFIVSIISFARTHGFILRQAKDFFAVPHSGLTTEVTETTSEFRFQFFLGAQTCLLAAIITFFYVQERIADTFILRSQYMMIWIFFGCYLGYFLLKAFLYAIVNWAFFDKKSNQTWQKSLLFLTCVEGVVLFPLVLLLTYFNMSMQNVIIYATIVVVLTKLLVFYRTHIIFFRQNSAFLQNILYFCALEIVPLFSLWGILVTIVDFLKINF